MRVRTREVALTRAVRFLHPRIPLYIVPRPDGEFMIGATMIESPERGAVTVRSALELLNAAYALHPAFGEAEILEMSANVRPAYPDNEPRVEKDGADLRQRLVSPRLSASARLSLNARLTRGVETVGARWWMKLDRERRGAGRSRQ